MARKKIRDYIPNIQFTREILVLILILSLIGFIILNTLGGSSTLPFDQNGDQPNYQSEPDTGELPGNLGDGFNASGFGDLGLNPPAGAASDFAGIGDIDFGQPPNTNIGSEVPGQGFPNPGRNGGGVGNPNPGNDNPFEFNDPPNPSSGGIPNFNTSIDSPFGFPERDNKAENLWNLSNIEIFPNTSFSFSVDLSFPDFTKPGISNVAFFILILGLLYIPNLVVQRLLREVFRSSDGSSENDSIFFQPDESELQKRREMQRRKRLQNFADYLNEIVRNIYQMKEANIVAKEIITSTYLAVDEAFEKFINLKRNKSLTPLEHAHGQFENNEINNQVLEGIVNLFYLTRFGNKELGYESVDQMIDLLKNLVTQNEQSGNGWSIL